MEKNKKDRKVNEFNPFKMFVCLFVAIAFFMNCAFANVAFMKENKYDSSFEASSTVKKNNSDVQPGILNISLLYGDEKNQSEYPNGVHYYTHSTMSGYIRLEPSDLDHDLTDITVTLSMPKQYVEKDSVSIPKFNIDSSNTKYEILPVTEDENNYSISIHFDVYDKTQTLVLPFMLSFSDDVVPDNYQLPVTASTSCSTESTTPNIYKPLYKQWGIEKFVNSNNLAAFSRDGAEVVVTPLEENGNPYLDDLTYVDFAFVVNNYTNVNCSLNDFRDACQVTLTDVLPNYIDKDGVKRVAIFDADKNPGWQLSSDNTTVSKTYYGRNSADILLQIYADELHLRFPGLSFNRDNDGNLFADLDNKVQLTAVPSNESEGETHPTAEDALRFRMTNDLSTNGIFTKAATKGNIYDVESYKTNPYPWGIYLGNNKIQPLQHIIIQDRKIVEDDKVILEGMDEALKFVSLQFNTSLSKFRDAQTYADVIDRVVAYYADGTTQNYYVTNADDHGNFIVTFDVDKECVGYDIIFHDDYKLYYDEKVNLTAYTVYRDPKNTHVPNNTDKITYQNISRLVTSYTKDNKTIYQYLKAGHYYDMFPSVEKLAVNKLTLCNNETQKLWGGGGNHVGDVYFYLIQLSGTLLESDVKEYQDIRIVDLLPEGVTYEKIYLIQQANSVGSILDGKENYQPEIIENYRNSGRTAVIFHLNAENLQKALKSPPTDIYFGVRIDEDAHPGTIRNEVYVVGDNLDEYQESVGSTEDIYDLNNNGRTDDKVAYSFSDAVIITSESVFAEKFIAPAGSEHWNKHGLSIKAGTDFDYLLKVTNETNVKYTGLTVYDVLPQISDMDIFGNSSRNSEFRVYLRDYINAPGYTVFYTTSDEVYKESMHDMVNADIWTTTIDDLAKVTAFKLVADKNTVLAGQSSFQVRIPVKAASEYDRTFLEEKIDTDQETGTMTYVEAVNSFGYSADQMRKEKESNSVWARIPFAGFYLQKTDGNNGKLLAGAEFTLECKENNYSFTAVSDEQGMIHFDELIEGTYILKETKAPEGYKINAEPITITITQNSLTGEYTVAFGENTETGTSSDPLMIVNYAIDSPVAPDTGDGNIWLICSVSVISVSLAAILFCLKKHFE
ncbi:MAG: prealbumin-like fold domain-containing protein [Erysipelotrichia bacterium]|nr:prealbumin-like fold domain-containing protein [Erysipelotrichia bacterium]